MNAQRITLIGGPGSGKSTTAADLFVQLKKLGKNVEMIQEWIRRDTMRNGPMTNVFEQYRTLMHHRKEEENFPASVDYIIHDGNTLIGYFYAAVYSQKTDPKERLVIQDLYEAMLEDLYSKKYDKIYFIPRTFTDAAGATFNDGTRFQTPHERDVLENYMRLIFCEIHRMDNVQILDCPLHKRAEFLIQNILGDEAVNTWRALRLQEMAYTFY